MKKKSMSHLIPAVWPILLLLMVIPAGWSETVLIETRIQRPLDAFETGEKDRLLNIESGVMDALFENGFIFFNFYNAPDSNGRYESVEKIMYTAQENGSDYLLRIIPDESGVIWSLDVIGSGRGKPEQYEDISQVEHAADDIRWSMLGKIIGNHMLEFVVRG